MLKLLVVTPNPTVYDATVRIVQTTKFDAEVIQTTSRQVVEDVSKAMEGCTGIVVARGNQAQLLKKHVEYPVSEITFSGQEMAGFVKQACDLIPHKHPKIAFVGFRHMYSDVENIGALANADVRVYYAGSSDMVAQVTQNAIQDGAEAIIGSENACNYAAAQGITTVFVDSSDECIRDALRRARLAMDAIKVEQRRTAEFSSLLNYSFDAILKLNPDGVIEIANTVAENAFHCTQAQLVGKRFAELPGLTLTNAVFESLKERKNLYSHVVMIQKERYLLNIACIDVSGQNFGTILSLYAFGSVDDMQESIRKDHVQQSDAATRKFGKFISHAPKMRLALENAAMYAQYELPLLICGEPGTEKTRLAECIHNESLRRDKQFIQADVSTLPIANQTELLFGRATSNGLVYNAHKGTLYLRHVDLLTPESQHQLLNVIRYEQYYAPGQSKPIWASIRVICSTNRDLLAMAKAGEFLLPLADKLNDYRIDLPPLRECQQDFAQLVEENIVFARVHTRKQATFTPDALKLLMSYSWPGNQREMSIFFEKAFLLTRTNRMDADFVQQLLYPARADSAPQQQVLVISSDEERELRCALSEHPNDRDAVLKQLGISRATLYRRMKKYGLQQEK